MTTIKGSSPVRIAPTTATSTSATSSSSSAATGSGVRNSLETSSFTSAATGTGSSGGSYMQTAISGAKDALKDVDGGGDKDKLMAWLDNKNPSTKDTQAAMDAYNNIAGDLSEDQRKTIGKAITAKNNSKVITSQMLSQMEKAIADIQKRGIKSEE